MIAKKLAGVPTAFIGEKFGESYNLHTTPGGGGGGLITGGGGGGGSYNLHDPTFFPFDSLKTTTREL